jgi:methyltransferase family protein
VLQTSASSQALSGTASHDLIEELHVCPLCGSARLERLIVRNMNARDPERIREFARLLGSAFFMEQSLAICLSCDHLFQVRRPTPDGLVQLYAAFANALGKIAPSEDNMLEYLLRHNSKDYVTAVASSVAFLEHHHLLDDVSSALEVRTYGGALTAILQERGVAHCEAGYTSDFDAKLAQRVFGLSHLHPFSYSTGLTKFMPSLPTYDLIVMYEGLTHSRDPLGVIEWLRTHLSENGHAVLFREPNTPAYRRYFPLEVVFNTFHLHLFSKTTIDTAINRVGGIHGELLDDYHESYPTPLYISVILRNSSEGKSDREEVISASLLRPRYGYRFYASWIARDKSRRRAIAERAVGKMRRELSRVWRAAAGAWRPIYGRSAPDHDDR